MKLLLSLLSVFLLVQTQFFGLASAQELTISNGSNSDTSLVIDSGTVVNVVQTNQAVIKNNISTSTNTGSNHIDSSNGGSITTGDAKTQIKVTNLINHNSTQTCCSTPSPTPAPTTSPINPTTTPLPTSPPTSTSSSSPSTSSGSGSAIGGSSPVLGLSATSSDQPLPSNLALVLASLCLSGVALLVRGTFPA